MESGWMREFADNLQGGMKKNGNKLYDDLYFKKYYILYMCIFNSTKTYRTSVSLIIIFIVLHTAYKIYSATFAHTVQRYMKYGIFLRFVRTTHKTSSYLLIH